MKLNYKAYINLRNQGYSVSEISNDFIDELTDDDNLIRPMMKSIIGMLIGVTMFSLLPQFCKQQLPDGNIWITSPSGNTDKLLPIPLAFRIIRKHDWYITETEPIKPPITINRMDALKIFLRGNK